jgi:3-oxoacyl-[acyl-carrier protein] reductase
MNLGLTGKTALVTASSKGIGKAVAEELASEGCNLAICSRTKYDLENIADDIKRKYGVDVSWSVCDLNKFADIENTFKIVLKQFGKIDILINNCGGPTSGFFRDFSDNEWVEAFEQVFLSAVRFSNLVLPGMIAKQWGRIINITSVSVKQPIDNLVLSNSFRTAIIGFAKSLSNEFAKYNITVNNVAPGYTLTNRLYDLAVSRAKTSDLSHEEVLSDMAKQVPMNRFARPEEIGAIVSFLCSNQAGYITGNTIHIDGGWVKGLF